MANRKIVKPKVNETPTEPDVNPEGTITPEEEETTEPETDETETIETPIEVPEKSPVTGIKVYSSSIYPNHKIGNNIRFVNGSYSTAKQAEQEAIERDPLFGQKIFLSK